MPDFSTQGARPVWIASYPRSGNTYLRILLEKVFGLVSYSIYYVDGATHRDPSADALEDAPLLPYNWRELLNKSKEAPLAAIKTHDLPFDSAPAIFIARDGRATINSYYHYHQKFAFEQPSLTEIIAGACQFGSWSDHYWGWHPKSRPETLILTYDELVNTPESVVQSLAKFLNLPPAHTSLPAFEELQKKNPAFFRRGQNTDYLKEWTPGHLALFNELHGSAMADLGFEVTPVNESVAAVAKDLARSAARLHHLYLEQLTNFGRCESNHHLELERLKNQLRDFSHETNRLVNDWLKRPWIRLGLTLRAVPPLASIKPLPLSAPDEPSTPTSPPRVKSSGESSQSSSPNPAPNSLAAPSEDASARG